MLIRIGQDPSEVSPDLPVNWNAPDIQIGRKWDIPTIRHFLRLPKSFRAIYPSIIEVCYLDPKIEEDDDFEEYRFKRGGFPPICIRKTKGKLTIIDGNHRVYWCQQVGYETIAAYVVDDDLQRKR
jgi:hypothetical protein